jgi:hypothetical protein
MGAFGFGSATDRGVVWMNRFSEMLGGKIVCGIPGIPIRFLIAGLVSVGATAEGAGAATVIRLSSTEAEVDDARMTAVQSSAKSTKGN